MVSNNPLISYDKEVVMNVALNLDNQYAEAFKANNAQAYEKIEQNNKVQNPLENHQIHNAAVNVSISMESMQVFLNIKSAELSQSNTTAQNVLNNIVNGTQWQDFFEGKVTESGFSLSSIGYTGKAFTELTSSEASELISDNGFFGVTETSTRVSSFVMNMSGDNIVALQESRNGLVQGFEEAEKLWGGNLPEISYETQKETLRIIDEKIAELLKTDSQKALDT